MEPDSEINADCHVSQCFWQGFSSALQVQRALSGMEGRIRVVECTVAGVQPQDLFSALFSSLNTVLHA